MTPPDLRRRALPAALLLALLLPFPATAQDGTEPGPRATPDAEALVARLASDHAEERAAAERALFALGEAVRPVLEAHLEGADIETRRRIRSVLERLDDALRARTGAGLTWAGLRGGPTRCGVAGGAIPAREPERVWAVRVQGVRLMQGSVVPGRERVMALSSDGVVRCYAAQDGARRWLSNLEARISASAVLAAERLVVPTERGIVALDARTGRRVWEQPAEYGCDAAPAVNGTLVYAALRNLGVRAYDVASGEQRFDAPMAPSGALLVDGDLIVAGTEDGELVRLDPVTGRRLWRVRLGSAPNMGPTLAGPGMIAVLARDRYLRVVGTERGETLWERRLPRASRSESLVAAAGRLVLTDAGGALRAFDAGTGRPLWQRDEGMLEVGGPCATTARVLWGARGRLTCRDARSGVLQWRVDLDAIDAAVPVVFGETLYFLTDGELVAFREPTKER